MHLEALEVQILTNLAHKLWLVNDQTLPINQMKRKENLMCFQFIHYGTLCFKTNVKYSNGFLKFLISVHFVNNIPDILKSANYWQILMEPLSWIYFIFAKSQLNGKSALSCSRHFPIVLTRRWSLIHLGTICDNFFFNIEKQSWILEISPIFGNRLYAFLYILSICMKLVLMKSETILLRPAFR